MLDNKPVLIIGLIMIFSLGYTATLSLSANLGHLAVINQLVNQTGDSQPSTNPLYGIGLRSGDDQAIGAEWSLPLDIKKVNGNIYLGTKMLEFSQAERINSNAIWLSRLNLLLRDNNLAEKWAKLAIENGFSGGKRELAYVFDADGDYSSAVKEYADISSKMSQNFQVGSYLSLAENCATASCKMTYYTLVAQLDPKNPVAVWNLPFDDLDIADAIFYKANWSYLEPRLQRHMALTLLDVMRNSSTLSPSIWEILLYWINNNQLEAATKFLDTERTILNEADLHLWYARIAARNGDFELAYEETKIFLSSYPISKCQEAYCRELIIELTIYANALARQSQPEIRQAILAENEQLLENSRFRDFENLTHLVLSENYFEVTEALYIQELLEQSCATNNLHLSLEPDTLYSMDISNLEEWSWNMKVGLPYAQGLYSTQIAYVGAHSEKPVLQLQGLAIAPQRADEWPSWVGMQLTNRGSVSNRKDLYFISFAYRTDYKSGWGRTRFLPTPELEYWLPDTEGQWQYYGFILPKSYMNGLELRPIFRLYHSVGSFYLSDLRVKGLSNEGSVEECIPTGGVFP